MSWRTLWWGAQNWNSISYCWRPVVPKRTGENSPEDSSLRSCVFCAHSLPSASLDPLNEAHNVTAGSSMHTRRVPWDRNWIGAPGFQLSSLVPRVLLSVAALFLLGLESWGLLRPLQMVGTRRGRVSRGIKTSVNRPHEGRQGRPVHCCRPIVIPVFCLLDLANFVNSFPIMKVTGRSLDYFCWAWHTYISNGNFPEVRWVSIFLC